MTDATKLAREALCDDGGPRCNDGICDKRCALRSVREGRNRVRKAMALSTAPGESEGARGVPPDRWSVVVTYDVPTLKHESGRQDDVFTGLTSDAAKDLIASLAGWANIVRVVVAPAPPAAPAGKAGMRRVRHVKRGTEYTVLGRGFMQTEVPLSDMEPVILYRGDDGKLWARPEDEFNDGRFVALAQETSND